MEIPRHWRLKLERYRLIGNVVDGTPVFPPRPIVPEHMKRQNGAVVIFSSKLPLYTSDSCMEELKKQPQRQEQ